MSDQYDYRVTTGMGYTCSCGRTNVHCKFCGSSYKMALVRESKATGVPTWRCRSCGLEYNAAMECKAPGRKLSIREVKARELEELSKPRSSKSNLTDEQVKILEAAKKVIAERGKKVS